MRTSRCKVNKYTRHFSNKQYICSLQSTCVFCARSAVSGLLSAWLFKVNRVCKVYFWHLRDHQALLFGDNLCPFCFLFPWKNRQMLFVINESHFVTSLFLQHAFLLSLISYRLPFFSHLFDCLVTWQFPTQALVLSMSSLRLSLVCRASVFFICSCRVITGSSIYFLFHMFFPWNCIRKQWQIIDLTSANMNQLFASNRFFTCDSHGPPAIPTSHVFQNCSKPMCTAYTSSSVCTDLPIHNSCIWRWAVTF